MTRSVTTVTASRRFSTYLPSEFSRLRLQCNYDHAQHLDHDALSIWLGVEFLFGKHPVHTY